MAVITDTTMQTLASKIEAGNTVLSNYIDKYKWVKIQADVRAGKASQYAIGTELLTTYTYEGTTYACPWVVLDNNRQCEWADGTTHPGLWIGMKYATIEDVQFDAKEGTDVDLTQEPNALEGWYYWGLIKINSGTSYAEINVSTGDALPTTYTSGVKKCGFDNLNVLRFGYGRWSHSAQRQWLNSDGDAGEWWSPQHLGDLPPSQLASIKGFKAGLPDDFLAVITPVKIKTICNTDMDGGVTDTTVDTFFLQSLEEVYGFTVSDVEGPYFPYWKQVTGLDNPSSGSSSNQNNARKIKRVSSPTGSAVTVYLRSAGLENAGGVCYMVSSGYIDSYAGPAGGDGAGTGAFTSNAALPACVIS